MGEEGFTGRDEMGGETRREREEGKEERLAHF